MSQDWLSPSHKIFFNLVRRSVVPRSESRNRCTKMDLTYMELIHSGIPIDLPRVMITHIVNVSKADNHSLVYGTAITKILEALEVSLDPNKGEGPPSKEIMRAIALANHGLHVVDGFITKMESLAKAPLVVKAGHRGATTSGK